MGWMCNCADFLWLLWIFIHMLFKQYHSNVDVAKERDRKPDSVKRFSEPPLICGCPDLCWLLLLSLDLCNAKTPHFTVRGFVCLASAELAGR
jgi:hypothetical protein